jgi:hypothetical protein
MFGDLATHAIVGDEARTASPFERRGDVGPRQAPTAAGSGKSAWIDAAFAHQAADSGGKAV